MVGQKLGRAFGEEGGDAFAVLGRVGVVVGGRRAAAVDWPALESVRLLSRAARGASAAMRCACASASPPSSASGTHAQQEAGVAEAVGAHARSRPAACRAPAHRRSAPRTSAASRGAIGKPSFAIGAPNFDAAPARRMSQQLAISRPAPMQAPSICATSGSSHASIAARRGPDLVLVEVAQAGFVEAERRVLGNVAAGAEGAALPAHDHAAQWTRPSARPSSNTARSSQPHGARHRVQPARVGQRHEGDRARRAPAGPAGGHSSLAPEAFTTPAQRLISELTKLP